MSGKNDFSNYREMSKPFSSIEEANEALNNFYSAVEEARKKFRMMDVHLIVKMNVLRGKAEGEALTAAHYGNTLEGAPMCAWGLGQEQARFEGLIREYIKGE